MDGQKNVFKPICAKEERNGPPSALTKPRSSHLALKPAYLPPVTPSAGRT